MNPATRTFADVALGPGQSFTDAAAGVTLRLVSADAAGATVSVTFGDVSGTCVRGNPAITLSGQNQPALAGTTVSYAALVTNRDSQACNTSAFDLSAQVAPGWFAAFAAPGITLAPGESGYVLLSVSSPVDAAAGVYGSV